MYYPVVSIQFFCRSAGAVALALAAFHAPAWAADEGIVTDRPDFVESSNVVGFQRFQVETSIAVDRSRSAAERERVVSTPTLLRYGIGDALELLAESDGRISSHNRTLPGGEAERATGYADAALGLKWHVADAAGASPSLGVLLHIDTPSGSRGLRGGK